MNMRRSRAVYSASWLAVLLLCLSAVPPRAFAAGETLAPGSKPSVYPVWNVRNRVLYIDGEIHNHLWDELLMSDYDRPEDEKIRHIELNSYGGLVSAGIEIAEIVRARGITTNIRENARCASICTLVYQAGVRRTAHPSATIMIHGARVGEIGMMKHADCMAAAERNKNGNSDPEKLYADATQEYCESILRKWEKENWESTRQMFSLLEKYGASPRLYQEYLKRPEAPDWFERGNLIRIENWEMRAAEALRYNIIQEIGPPGAVAAAWPGHPSAGGLRARGLPDAAALFNRLGFDPADESITAGLSGY